MPYDSADYIGNWEYRTLRKEDRSDELEIIKVIPLNSPNVQIV